ncbi:hypothetical protein KBD18_00240 [Patescibacteria group bacterium]|nr:hypothetical protein [Patescibacteria group bacterium]
MQFFVRNEWIVRWLFPDVLVQRYYVAAARCFACLWEAGTTQYLTTLERQTAFESRLIAWEFWERMMAERHYRTHPIDVVVAEGGIGWSPSVFVYRRPDEKAYLFSAIARAYLSS